MLWLDRLGTASRRRLGSFLAGGGLAALLGSAPGALTVDAKKKGKKKRRKTPQPQSLPPLVFNQFGCIEVGQPCRGDSTNCCSGICQGTAPAEGQPDQSRCIAHGSGTCSQATPGVCTADNPSALKCNNNSNCLCLRTTAGSNYCYGAHVVGVDFCADCSKDADCEALGYAPGSAYALVSEGHCAGLCSTGMACLPPCSTVPPGP